jgi:hypothetical protein
MILRFTMNLSRITGSCACCIIRPHYTRNIFSIVTRVLKRNICNVSPARRLNICTYIFEYILIVYRQDLKEKKLLRVNPASILVLLVLLLLPTGATLYCTRTLVEYSGTIVIVRELVYWLVRVVGCIAHSVAQNA